MIEVCLCMLCVPLRRLVELCVVISLPGAPQQRTHTDVAPFLKGTLWTTWVALQVCVLCVCACVLSRV